MNSSADSRDRTSLRGAIIAANRNKEVDTIRIEPGVYTLRLPGIDDDAQGGDLDITESVVIEGLGTDKFQTVIDANQMDRVFDVIGDIDVTFRNLTITGGLVAGTGPAGSGGGVRNAGADVTFETVAVDDNTASIGGGVANVLAFTTGRSGSYFEQDSCVRFNTATTGNGGGIYSGDDDGGIGVTNTEVLGNSAALSGGGIFMFHERLGPFSFLSINGSDIIDNQAGADGGGAYVSGVFGSNKKSLLTRQTVSNSLFHNNSAARDGGGFFVFNGLAVDRSTFTANRAERNGGAIASFFDVRIIDTTIGDRVGFTANEAQLGGGIYMDGRFFTNHKGFSPITLQFWSSSIVRNLADHGGGVYLIESRTNLQDFDVSENRAIVSGGGLFLRPLNYFDYGGNFVPVLRRGTVADNLARVGSGLVPVSTGGGVQLQVGDDRDVWFERVEFRNNHADLAGGAIVIEDVPGAKGTGIDNRVRFDACGINENEVGSFLANSEDGGGIYIDTSDDPLVELFNTTVSSNTADRGAAVASHGPATVHLAYTTVADNTSLSPATASGGIWMTGGTFRSAASLYANNDFADCQLIGASLISEGYNVFEDICGNGPLTCDNPNFAAPGTDILGGNSLVCPGAVTPNVGLDVLQASPTSISRFHPLLAGNSAIAIVPLSGPFCSDMPLGVDQRGDVANFPRPGAPISMACDAGAFESQETVATLPLVRAGDFALDSDYVMTATCDGTTVTLLGTVASGSITCPLGTNVTIECDTTGKAAWVELFRNDSSVSTVFSGLLSETFPVALGDDFECWWTEVQD
ncbi:MAG: hypothetical protein AAGA48_11575 [Myxococcota bacterium]